MNNVTTLLQAETVGWEVNQACSLSRKEWNAIHSLFQNTAKKFYPITHAKPRNTGVRYINDFTVTLGDGEASMLFTASINAPGYLSFEVSTDSGDKVQLTGLTPEYVVSPINACALMLSIEMMIQNAVLAG